MRSILNIIILIIIIGGLQSCYKEEIIFNSTVDHDLEPSIILRINNKDCSYDHNSSMLRYPIANDSINNFSPFIQFQDYSTVYFEGSELGNHTINNLGNIVINSEYEVIIKTKNETKRLSLTFTNLPIVQITTPNKIYDEPKTIGKFFINHNNLYKGVSKYFIGIEYRGGTSQLHKKKSYDISFKRSLDLDDNISISLFDMNKNNDWILDAMYIDRARLRNKISFELWNTTDGKNNHGIGSEFVELFINNEHHGLYCLNEKVNSELLDLNNKDAVLYKAIAWENGATQFKTFSNNTPHNYYWDGWEQKYPNPKNIINWEPLRDLRNLVVNENNEIFLSQISSSIDLDNFTDYYIFLNLVYAFDNTGKNTFIAKEGNQQRFYIMPWDLDGSWGISWDGTRIGYTSILSNNLYNRLLTLNPDNFRKRIKLRWNNLRNESYSNIEILKLFDKNFEKIINSGVMDIENNKWGVNININSEREYLFNWFEKRISFLDIYFSNL